VEQIRACGDHRFEDRALVAGHDVRVPSADDADEPYRSSAKRTTLTTIGGG
jgi:hypothetical protein